MAGTGIFCLRQRLGIWFWGPRSLLSKAYRG